MAPKYTLDKARELMGESINDLNFRFLKRDLKKDNKRVQVHYDEEAKHRIGEVRQIQNYQNRIQVTLIKITIPLSYPSLHDYKVFIRKMMARENIITDLEPKNEFDGTYQIIDEQEITARLRIRTSVTTKM